jgi:hypothetical protein
MSLALSAQPTYRPAKLHSAFRIAMLRKCWRRPIRPASPPISRAAQLPAPFIRDRGTEITREILNQLSGAWRDMSVARAVSETDAIQIGQAMNFRPREILCEAPAHGKDRNARRSKRKNGPPSSDVRAVCWRGEVDVGLASAFHGSNGFFHVLPTASPAIRNTYSPFDTRR